MSHLTDLGLPDTATAAEVKAAFREKAQELHPDHGGDPVEFDALRNTYMAALSEIANRKCSCCNGTKKVERTIGFRTIKLACPLCVKDP